MSQELWSWSAADLAKAISERTISSREAVQSSLQRIAAVNPALNAVVEVLEKEALETADVADAAVKSGFARGPLHGVPVTTKVNVDQRGCATTNGVVAFRDVIATEDSPAVANLRKAGASRMVGGANNNRGEALRYLAELPWNPDGILHNRSLGWAVVDAETIRVTTGVGAERGEVTFELDDNGLVVRASAASRLYVEKGRTTSHPWRGRFWDYQPIAGRVMPLQGEVAWVLDAGDFVYWRGHMLSWSAGSTPMQAIGGNT